MSETRELAEVIRSIDGPATLGSLELAEGIVAAGYQKVPGHYGTEWGVRSPWGESPSADYETAHKVAENMRGAGLDAVVIWRGVTDWMEEGDPE